MGKDNVDILREICSFDGGANSSGMVDVAKEKPEYRALPLKAIEAGCRDVIDSVSLKRFIVSPFDFSEIFRRSPAHPLVEFPKFIGRSDSEEGVCYIFEIPISAIALELMPDLERVVEGAEGTGSPFESFHEALKETRAENPGLSPEVFADPSGHWASDTRGRFILVFPFTDSDRDS